MPDEPKTMHLVPRAGEPDDLSRDMDETQVIIDADVRQLRAMNGERIYYRRIINEKVDLTARIYLGKLTDEQKRQLTSIEQQLFDLADEVREEEARFLKGPAVKPEL